MTVSTQQVQDQRNAKRVPPLSSANGRSNPQKQPQTVPWLTTGQYYEADIVAGNRAGVKHH